MMFDVYYRVEGTQTWVRIAAGEAIQQAQQIEDHWIYKGYDTKIINRATGRSVKYPC